jgi:glycerol kinase
MPPPRYILALDQGTSGSTALVVDAEGVVRARGYAELTQHYPQPGWVEHDPEEIWSTVGEAARRALAEARVTGSEIAAVGITNQRETTIVWERATGNPIHRAIVWQCRRTAAMCDALKASGAEALVRERTGLVLDAYFSGTKIAWLLDHVPWARRRAERGELAFGTVDSWLVWKLTGGRIHVTDATNASRTLCLGLRTVAWDDEMLARLTIPREVLPTVVDSSGPIAETNDLGWLPAGVPITGIAGDQQAALFGQACYEVGSAKNTYGTGCFVLLNTGDTPVASGHGLLTTVAWRIGGRAAYALEGSVFIAGAAVQWIRDGLGLITSAGETEALARSVTDTGGVHFVPAFRARRAVLGSLRARHDRGLTRAPRAPPGAGHTRSHRLPEPRRADAMAADAGRAARLKVDGGAVANNFLCQFQADVLDTRVLRPAVIETTAMGRFLAGLGSGFWRSLDALASRQSIERTFTPRMDTATRAGRYEGWRRAVERSRHWEKESV